MSAFRIPAPDPGGCDACEAIAGGSPDEWVVVRSYAHTTVFITDRQRSVGSILVVPHRHVTRLGELDPTSAGHLVLATRDAARCLTKVYEPESMHIWTGAGVLAGQSMAHMHVQVVPRYPDRPYSFAPSAEIPLTSLETRLEQARELRKVWPVD